MLQWCELVNRVLRDVRRRDAVWAFLSDWVCATVRPGTCMSAARSLPEALRCWDVCVHCLSVTLSVYCFVPAAVMLTIVWHRPVTFCGGFLSDFLD